VVDVKKAAALAKQHKLISMIDSTFATPINQHPAEYGIDLVMHSGTKYLSGHADLTCGVVAGRAELVDEIDESRKTLAVRVTRQNENALRVAEFLKSHAKVRRVHYPFLKSHPDYAIAREQMTGGSGMVTFEVEGTGEDARRVSEAMHLFTLATSLGGVESLVSIPVLTSHAMISAEQRAKMGVTEQMVRLSVGIENADDLIADLERALEGMGARSLVPMGNVRL
jgi:cystathionine beta-lyase/cystathionine gamma-synthase